MAKTCRMVFLFVQQLVFISGVFSATFTIKNNCGFTVWPGVISNAGIAPLSTAGFSLQSGESRHLAAPSHWGGRFWGRTQCATDASGRFSCVTGDCGSGQQGCTGGAKPPATLAEFTLQGAGGLDFYDVSLVDGYNLPVMVAPQGGDGNCSTTGCVVELNGACPVELRLLGGSGGGESVACRSACDVFGNPQYCCSGAYGTPDACKPSSYSQFFKHACPRAYSYAYDDRTSTFTCASADYVITFCPNLSSEKSATADGGGHSAVQPPLVNTSMIFTGFGDLASHSGPRAGVSALAVAAAVAAALWRLRLF